MMHIGIEIECLVSQDYFEEEVGDYHCGEPVPNLPGWRAEEDSSIQVLDDDAAWERYDDPERDFQGVEFVSEPYYGITEFRKGLKRFKKYFLEKSPYLNSVMYFNNSTGSHVHLSIPGFSFSQRALWKAFETTREQFKEMIKSSGISSRRDIIRRYVRQYATEGRRRHRTDSSSRYFDFKFHSEREVKGLEWRAPNMKGIQTWKEFDEYWDIVIECLKTLEKLGRECEEHTVITFERPDARVYEVRDTDELDPYVVSQQVFHDVIRREFDDVEVITVDRPATDVIMSTN